MARFQLTKDVELNEELREKLCSRMSQMEGLSAHAAEMIKQLMTFARKGNIEKKGGLLSDFMRDAIKQAEISLPSNIHFQYEGG